MIMVVTGRVLKSTPQAHRSTALRNWGFYFLDPRRILGEDAGLRIFGRCASGREAAEMVPALEVI